MNYAYTLPILTFLTVVCFGGAIIVVIIGRRSAVYARLHQVDHVDGLDSPTQNKSIAGLLEWLGKTTSKKGPSDNLRSDLARAGFYHQSAGTIFLGTKIFFIVLGLVLSGFIITLFSFSFLTKLWLVVGGAFVFGIIPNIFVRIRRSRRCRMVRNALPDAVDLLEICVTSGMGIDMAWNAVADELRESAPILGDEMALANLEMHLGAARADAMRNMAQRTGADELASLASLLVQSDRFGTSIGEALRVFASSMRENRRQAAEEHAEKMAVKLLFPLVLFIFPSILLVCGGPAAIKIAQMFS